VLDILILLPDAGFTSAGGGVWWAASATTASNSASPCLIPVPVHHVMILSENCWNVKGIPVSFHALRNLTFACVAGKTWPRLSARPAFTTN
jgi:hypothetical protein